MWNQDICTIYNGMYTWYDMSKTLPLKLIIWKHHVVFHYWPSFMVQDHCTYHGIRIMIPPNFPIEYYWYIPCSHKIASCTCFIYTIWIWVRYHNPFTWTKATRRNDSHHGPYPFLGMPGNLDPDYGSQNCFSASVIATTPLNNVKVYVRQLGWNEIICDPQLFLESMNLDENPSCFWNGTMKFTFQSTRSLHHDPSGQLAGCFGLAY